MRLIARDPAQLIAAGYPSLAHIPFLIDDDGTYPDEANRYIRVRSLCEWPLRLGNDSQPSNPSRRFLTPASSRTVAWRIGTFLAWCRTRNLDWRTVTYYDDIILGWQTGLLTGVASKSGKALGHDATNALVSEACYFLTWAGEPIRNLRPPFQVLVSSRAVSVSNGTSSKGTRQKHIQSRAGALASPPSTLHLASPKEVGTWMRGMRSRYVAKALMAELIIETGIRISECCQWRIDTLPPREHWLIYDGKLVVTIRHGIKGPKVAPGSTLSVRPREIEIPVDLALRIHHYATVTRPTQIVRWIKEGKTKEERARRSRSQKPALLWLSEFTHQPFDSKQLYNAWVSSPGCPHAWHPHAGRHYFAVETAVEWLRNDLKARGSNGVPDLSWIQAVARDQIRMILSPKMGHASPETTLIYLKSAHTRLAQEYDHSALRWQMFCDEERL